MFFCSLFWSMTVSAVIRDGGVDPANLGQGAWLYMLNQSTNHLYPSNIAPGVTNENSLFAYLKSQNFNFVIVKAASGGLLVNNKAQTVPIGSPSAQFTSSLVQKAHDNGLLIFGSNRSDGKDIPGEIAVADYVFNTGADGFIYDAESEWESQNAWIGTNGPALAWQLCSTVRSNWPTKFIAHNPYATAYLHFSFPFKEFGYWCDAVIPQVYHFAATKDNAFAAIHWMDVNYRELHSYFTGLAPSVINGETIYWTNSIKPLALMRDVYNGMSGTPLHPDSDVRNFIDYLTADPNCVTPGGYRGSSYFRSELHTAGQWANIRAATVGIFPNVVNNIVLDDARATRVGSWTLVKTIDATTGSTVSFTGEFGTDTNSFGTNYWKKTQGTGAAYMQFTPNILTAGDYNVYEWHPSRPDASANVPVVINYNGGSATVNVNQQANAGDWTLLGRFNFATGTTGTIRIQDNFSDPSAVATVDALKMVFVPPTTVPATPTLLTATAASSSQINLGWRDNATNETAYFVARSTTSGGPYTTIATLGINSTNYSDTGLLQGTTYYYVVKATNYLGASAHSTQASATTTSANSVPTITTQPQNQTVGLSSNATFTVSANGTAPLLYQWRFKGGNIALATNSSYTKSNAQPADEGGYAVVVSNAFGSVTSAVANLTVVLPPSITLQPQSRTNNLGTTAIFSVSATGQNIAYQWKKNGVTLVNEGNVSGATASTLTLTSVSVSDAANYTVTITNVGGTVTSETAVLTVIVPPTITSPPQNKSVTLGSNATFSVVATGTAPLSYQWRHGASNIFGATASNYTVSNAQVSDGGTYSVVVTNAAGSVTSANVALNVIVPGSTVLSLTNIWNIQAGSRPYVTTGNTERGLTINDSTGHVLIVSRSAAVPGSLGIYILDAENGAEIGTMNTASVANNGTFKLNKIAVADDGAIYGANLTSAAGTNFVVYRWANEGAVPTVAYSGLPDGGVTARWGDSFAVTGSGVNTRMLVSSSTATNLIIFTTADGANFVANKLNPSPSVAGGEFWGGLSFAEPNYFYTKNRSASDSKKYSYNIAGNSCALSSSVTPLDGSMIGIAIDPSRQLLFGVVGDNSTNNANHSLKAYDISNPAAASVISNFYFLPSASGTCVANPNYAAAVDFDATRIIGLDTQNGIVALKILVQNPPLILAQPADETVNAGQTATFNVTASGDAPLAYQWRKDNVAIAGATTSSLVIVNATATNAGSYTVTVSNVVDSVTSDPAVLTVITPPSIASSPSSSTNNAGSTAIFTVTATGSGPLSYQWLKNDVALGDNEFISGSDTNTLVVSSLSQNDAGSYSVVVSNVAGTVTSGHAVLTVIDPPVITSDPSDVTQLAGTTAIFTVSATGTEPLAYQWQKDEQNLTDGGTISGAHTANLSITGISQNDAASYRVIVSNPADTVPSASATLTVISAPVIITQPSNQIARLSSNATFIVVAKGTAPLNYQWRFNGTNIAGATQSAYTLLNVQSNNIGLYSVAISNALGSVLSSNATLTFSTDVTRPVVKIVSPASNQRLFENVNVTNYLTRISGTASDAGGLAAVKFSINDGEWQTASGTGNWSANALISPGLNKLVVKSIDLSGNQSLPASRSFTYVVNTPFTLNIVGPGTVVSNLNGQLLEIGATYKMTAIPASNHVFTNWTQVIGGATNVYATTNILKFVMQSNLVLNANFITNPFVRAAGVYSGLFYETNEITHESAGFFTLKLRPNFAFSGKLYVDGNALPISGKFALPGTFTKIVDRSKLKKGNLTLNLELDFNSTNDQIAGSIVATNWTAELSGDRAVWATNNIPALYTNAYTFAIPGFSNALEGPIGWGYGLVTIDKLGRAKLTGALPDGQAIKQSFTPSISKDGKWPLFAALYRWTNVVNLNGILKTNQETQGSLMGWLNFMPNTSAGKTNLAPMGNISWIKTGWTNNLFPQGFTNTVEIVGSGHRYTKGTRTLNFTNATVTMDGGNLTSPFTNEVVFTTNSTFTVVLPSQNSFKLSTTAKSGLIRGSFIHPQTGLIQPYFGVLLQDRTNGFGFFTNNASAGSLELNSK